VKTIFARLEKLNRFSSSENNFFGDRYFNPDLWVQVLSNMAFSDIRATVEGREHQ
jgi:hypothetical protein